MASALGRLGELFILHRSAKRPERESNGHTIRILSAA